MEITNMQYAKSNADFIAACSAVNLPTTGRQASKFRRKTGKAYKEGLLQVKGKQNG